VREAARRRILDTVPDDALVLDVGGWAVPFPRADWVLDLGAYETRGEWGYEGERSAERFTAETYVQRDICDREPWPFADAQFDFAICSHTLEDVRDPVWVCSELSRVAKAGYVEVPSRLQEQSWGVQGEMTGWSHHHWLIEVVDGGLEFLFKSHLVHSPGYHLPAFPDGAEATTHLWWEGTLEARERISLDPYVVDADLRDFVTANGGATRGRRRNRRAR
jgi:methyltransferase family protein